MKNTIPLEFSICGSQDNLVSHCYLESAYRSPMHKVLIIIRYILAILFLTFLISVLAGTTQEAMAAMVYVTEDETISQARTIPNDDTVRILPGVTMTVTNTGKLCVLGTIQNLGTIHNNGDVIIEDSGAVDNGALIINANTIANKSGIVGITNLSGATMNNISGTIINQGIMINRSGGAINNENVGTIENHDGGTIENQGSLNNYFSDIENHEGGMIQNFGLIDSQLGADITNRGTIEHYANSAINNSSTFFFLEE